MYLNAVDRDKIEKVIKIREKKPQREKEEILLSGLSEVKQTPSHPSENNSSSGNQKEKTSWDNRRSDSIANRNSNAFNELADTTKIQFLFPSTVRLRILLKTLKLSEFLKTRKKALSIFVRDIWHLNILLSTGLRIVAHVAIAEKFVFVVDKWNLIAN